MYDELNECQLDSTIISIQGSESNAFSIIDGDVVTWPDLLVEFAKVLNKADFFIDTDRLEEDIHKYILPNQAGSAVIQDMIEKNEKMLREEEDINLIIGTVSLLM